MKAQTAQRGKGICPNDTARTLGLLLSNLVFII